MSNDLVQLKAAITLQEPEFKKALPHHVPTDKFVRVLQTAVSVNQNLINADRASLFASAQRAAAMGLLPDGREGAIVEFGGKATFLAMVAGLMKMVRQSGQISSWSVQTVHENDEFDFAMGDEEFIKHKPALKKRGALVGAYSIVTMKDGEKSREFMNAEEIDAIRSRSRSGGSGPWKTDTGEMYKKTVVRRHIKRLPLSTDIDFDEEETSEPNTPSPAAEPAPAPAQKKSRLAAAVESAPGAVTDVEVIDSAGQVQHESPV
jgi:recombination protein RecT